MANETERRTNLGPGTYKVPKLREGARAKFSPPPGKAGARFEEHCDHDLRTEIQQSPLIGPAHYDYTKYESFPLHGNRSLNSDGANSVSISIPKEPRFFRTLAERHEEERRARLAPSDASFRLDEEFWSGCLPRISLEHRNTPRSKFLVPNPVDYLQKGDGWHVSEVNTDPRKVKRKMIPVDRLRSQSVTLPTTRVRSDPMAAYLSDNDEWKGKGPYAGYSATMMGIDLQKPNLARCGMASLVPRDESTILWAGDNISRMNPNNGPGANFDNEDQVDCQDTWGKHAAWERWKMDAPFRHPDGGKCPIVEQAMLLKQKKKPKDPFRGTVQSQFHGNLRAAVKRGDDWSRRPRKYSKEPLVKSGKAAAKVKSPNMVNIKSSSDAVIETVSL